MQRSNLVAGAGSAGREGQPRLAVELAPAHANGLSLRNPVMIASGTFGYDGYGRGITPEMDLSRLGAVIPKTFTRLPREGNPGTPLVSRILQGGQGEPGTGDAQRHRLDQPRH